MSSLLMTLREAAKTPVDRIDEVLGSRCTLRARADQVIYHAGDPSDAVYLLVSGYARAYVGDDQATRTTLITRGPALLGDRDVLANTLARDTVRMVTPGRLMVVDREEFMNEYKSSSALRAWLTQDITKRYATTIRWIEMDSISLVERLARLLDVLETPAPSIDVLANMLGLSRRSIFRALAELRASDTVIDKSEEDVPLVHTLTSEPRLHIRDSGGGFDTEDTVLRGMAPDSGAYFAL